MKDLTMCHKHDWQPVFAKPKSIDLRLTYLFRRYADYLMCNCGKYGVRTRQGNIRAYNDVDLLQQKLLEWKALLAKEE